jgi:pimeloyl-ACP methyl ester carboxylesterase
MKKIRSIYVSLFLTGLVTFSLILQPQGNSQVLANQGVTGFITPHNPTKFNQQFTHETALVNGVRIHYVIGGSGEPVVLLHGFPLTWYYWRKIMPTLAQRYTVIAPDLRGLGDSSKPSSGYDPQTLAEDIHQLVRQLGFQRILLVGHDWGGPVAYAYAYAAANRDEVQKLVILEAVIPVFGQGQQGVLPNTGQAPWHFSFHQVPDVPEALTAGRERLYIS